MSSCCPITGNVTSKDMAVHNFAAKAGTVCNLCVSNLTVTNSIAIPNPVCGNHPVCIDASTCNQTVTICPGFCGSILQYVNGNWGIYRSPGMLEVTVGNTGIGAPGSGLAPGANFPDVASAIGQSLITNCRFIRITDDTTEAGPLALPANTVIYVDPNVRWTVNGGITVAGGSLTLRGSGNSQLNIGQISGANEVNMFDINANVGSGMQGILGVPIVYVRDCVLVCTTNDFATGVGQLTIHDSTISLAGVALSQSVGTSIELTRVTIGGTPSAFLITGYALLEADEVTYTGSTATAIQLSFARLSEIRDNNPAGAGLLDLRVVDIGASAFRREVNGFYNGRFITNDTPPAGPPETWSNVIFRGISCQRLNLTPAPPISSPPTLFLNCTLDDFEQTDASVHNVQCGWQNCQITNYRTPPTTNFVLANNFFTIDTLQMTNIVTGEVFMNTGVDPVHWDITNMKAGNGGTTGISALNSNWSNIEYLGSMVWGNVFVPTNLNLENVVVTNDLTLFGQVSGALMASNITVGGLLTIGGNGVNGTNINCSFLNVNSGGLHSLHYQMLCNVTVRSSVTIDSDYGKYVNCRIDGALTINGSYNYLDQVEYAGALTVGITAVGNKLNAFRNDNGNGNFVFLDGDRNIMDDFIMRGSTGAAGNIFQVTGSNNQFTNIQLGDCTVTPGPPAVIGLRAFGSAFPGGLLNQVNLVGSNNQYTNMWVVTQPNRFYTQVGPIDLPEQVYIVLGGALNHFTNCVFYRDDINFPTLIAGPNNPVVFNNQDIIVSGDSNTFVNCRVGPNAPTSGNTIGTLNTASVGISPMFPAPPVFTTVGVNNMAVACRTSTPILGASFGPFGSSWLNQVQSNVAPGIPSAAVSSLDADY